MKHVGEMTAGHDSREFSVARAAIEETLRELGNYFVANYDEHKLGMGWSLDTHPGDERALTMYAGVTGIALFLLELSLQVPNARFRDTATRTMRHVVDIVERSRWLLDSLYTGKMGIAWTLLRFGEVTGEPEWIARSVKIARMPVEERTPAISDLLNGQAGKLLALIALRVHCDERWLDRELKRTVETIIAAARLDRRGCTWDRSCRNIGGLSGLSHGSAGIAFAMVELARTIPRCEGAEWVSLQALAYEESVFRADLGNWPDFRRLQFFENQEQAITRAYERGDLDFFVQGRDSVGWCYGAPGVAIAYLRAWEHFGEQRMLEAAHVALERTTGSVSAPRGPMCLCHGLAGNASVLIEAQRSLGAPIWTEHVLAAATSVATDLQKKGEAGGAALRERQDDSLFTGVAGMGYFLLESLSPSTTPSVLAPRASEAPQPRREIDVSASVAQCLVVSQHWPRTSQLLERELPGQLEKGLATAGAGHRMREDGLVYRPMRSEFRSVYHGLLERVTRPEARELLGDLYNLEEGCLDFDDARISDLFTFIDRQHLQFGAVDALAGGIGFESLVKASSDVKLVRSRWPGAGDSPIVLLMPRVAAEGTRLERISNLRVALLEAAPKPISITNLIAAVGGAQSRLSTGDAAGWAQEEIEAEVAEMLADGTIVLSKMHEQWAGVREC